MILSIIKKTFSIIILIFLVGCSSLPIESKDTSYPHDACKMLHENNDWLMSSYSSFEKWGVPISVQLAFIKYESSFKYNARPIKKRGLFSDTYHSTAYGYSQALNGTWEEYKQKTKNHNADRTSFKDSTDFIGWYLNGVSNQIHVKTNDIYNLYLAYHEGVGGWKNKSYKKKKWLLIRSKKLEKQAFKYSSQIKKCNF